jgi:hypothetical protein
LGAERHAVVYSDLSLAAMLQVEVPVDERRGFRAVDTSIADASAAGEDPGDPLVGTPEHERRLVRSDSAKVPIELEDALRLQSLGRLMHRLRHRDVANSPQRRAMVEQYRRETVMGTGVAERKVLGVASKEKIDDIIASGRYYEEAFGRDSKHFPATGLRRTAAYGKAGAMGLGAKDRANGIGLDYTEGALAFKAKDHRPIASLGVHAKTTPAEHSRLCELVAPEAPSLPTDRGWSIMGRTGGGNPNSSAFNGEDTAMNAALPEPSPKDKSSGPGMGPGDRRDSAYLRSENATPNGERRDGRDGTKASTPRERDEGSASRGGRRDGGRGGGGSSAKPGTSEDGSVLATLYGAGDAVRSLSLAERKALFEVGVHEHVSALTELLFPEEDGVSPRVNIDVSV